MSYKVLAILMIIIMICNFISVKNKSERYRNLKELKYFKILEEGSKAADFIERKKLNNEFKGCYGCLFFLGSIAIMYFGKRWEGNLGFYVISFTLLVATFLLLYFKYDYFGIYFYFYFLPILVYVLLKGSREGKVTIEYLCVIFFLYILMTFIYPVIYLRKIDSYVVLSGAFIVALVTICKDIVYPNFNYSFVGAVYAIGLFCIKLRIKYYTKIAKDKYSKLIKNNFLSADTVYDICKECVFYGGEEYKNRILDNKRLYNIITQKE